VLADPLGVSVAVVTGDGQLIVQKRSEHVFEYPGFFHVCGGNVEPTDVAGPDAPGVFAAARRELAEELGIGSPELVDLVCLGLAENRESHKPDLLFEAKVSLPAAAFASVRNAEYSEIVVIGGGDGLTAFLTDHAARFSPAGLACLLAVGRHRFGEKWFEDAVGGLRFSAERR
jgi:8-oxo-dGTP pyrophosphatase MutT (NUDIX family)